MRPAERGTAGNRPHWRDERDESDEGDEGAIDDAAAIRYALGVESAFGYHVEGRLRPTAETTDLPETAGERATLPRETKGLALPSGGGAASRRVGAFPCLDGHDYTGCLGEGCPLETCWTGGTTVSFARKMRLESRISTALYLPGAPCHTCAHLVEDEVAVPAPRQPDTRQPGASGVGRRRTDGAGDSAEMATLRRVTCAQGLWEHPISLASFVTKRIPMIDQDEPEQCPGYAPRPEPHPAVVAHLQRRRERVRLRREEQRAAGQEG